ncbi:PadR family transcriptional regulator [Spirillospora sp. NPDC127200]
MSEVCDVLAASAGEGFRHTLQVSFVLARWLVEPDREWYGIALAQATCLPQGTIYPMLARMADAGWVTVRDECPIEAALREGRRIRRYYRLTPEGRTVAEDAAALLRPQLLQILGAVS